LAILHYFAAMMLGTAVSSAASVHPLINVRYHSKHARVLRDDILNACCTLFL